MVHIDFSFSILASLAKTVFKEVASLDMLLLSLL